MKFPWTIRASREHELDEELAAHFEIEVKQRMEAGASREDAEFAARRAFGNVTRMKEVTRHMWGWGFLEQLVQDIRYAARTLRRNLVFTATALLILGLGIGANTAIFSLIDAVSLRTMPVHDPERLVEIARFWAGHRRTTLSYPLFVLLTDQSHSLIGMLAQSSPSKNAIDMDGGLETVDTQMVSGSYYEVLGIRPAAGRLWTREYDRAPGSVPFAVISYRFWRSRFGLDPSVIGRKFRLHQTVFTIVGVTPEHFFGTMPGHDPDITFPLAMDTQVNAALNHGKSWLKDPQTNWLSVIGRLKTGISRKQAEAELQVLFQSQNRIDAGRTNDARYKADLLSQELYLEPAGAGLDPLRVQFSEPLLYLMCMVGLVLLLACINLSSLLVGRTLTRSREIAVRMAVGAGRGRLIRQFLAESFALGLAGGVLGLAIAQLLCQFLLSFMANGEELFLPVNIDLQVLAFTGAVSLATSLLVGIAPALYGTQLNVSPGLKQVRIGERQRLAKALITAQLALSFLLVVGTGLFARTLINLLTLDAGFDRNGVLVFSIDSDKAGYTGQRLRSLQMRVLDNLQTLPGVRSASTCLVRMLSGGGWNGSVEVEGYTYRRGENNQANFNEVGPRYFETMGTPVLMGREFNARDLPGSPKVVIVNEAFARYYFGNKSPLGKHVKHFDNAVIVGVVKNAKYQSLKEAFPRTVYLPALQDTAPPSWTSYLVRSSRSDAPSATQSVQKAIRQIDPQLHLVDPVTLSEVVNQSILNERILALLSGFFGAIAILLASIGLFGATASYVARRTNEFGIRFALGAQRRDLFRAVLLEFATVIVTGLLLGSAMALGLTGMARSLLFGLNAADPSTFTAAAVVLMAAAFLGSAGPAIRASNVDPTEALRHE